MRRGAIVVACAVALSASSTVASAQVVDSARARAGTPRPDSGAGPVRAPLSPRRAFVYSLVLPGSAQSILGRPTAAAIFVVAEAAAITMIRQSAANLRIAQRFEDDSVVVRTVDPVTGAPAVRYDPPRYPAALVAARRAQVEDWIAALAANHLFSAADAFVAAHLWDVPAQLGLHATPARTALTARIRW